MTAALFSETSHSLVKKHLTRSVYKTLQHITTASGFGLEKAIRSGIRNPDSAIGIYAGDAESYQIFSSVFDPIIAEYHGFSNEQIHVSDFTVPDLPLIDPDNRFILSSRIRTARNLNHFCFPAHISLSDRKSLEKTVIQALESFKGDLAGRYLRLTDMGHTDGGFPDIRAVTFEKGDRFQEAAGINSDFPEGRGVFCSLDQMLRVWVNEEDHLRIISLEKTSDLSGAFDRLCRALRALERQLDFARDDRLGYLTSCPTNLGTAMRAGVHIRLEKLNQKQDVLRRLAGEYHLQIRGTKGEKTQVENAVFDISNARRLGISETGIIRDLHKGLSAIINAEKKL